MSLRRVSSRQRLVSWDAFDASYTQEEDQQRIVVSPSGSVMTLLSLADRSIDDLSLPFQTNNVFTQDNSSININTDALDDTLELKRKRRIATSEKVIPVNSPTLSSEAKHISSQSTQRPLYNEEVARNIPVLLQLPIEVQCSIYQFLNVRELRNVSQSCTSLRHSLLLQQQQVRYDSFTDKFQGETESDTSCFIESALWKPMCIKQYWPWLQHQHLQDAKFVFSTNRIDTCTNINYGVQEVKSDYYTKNYSVILSMASCTKVPMQIDTSLFPYSRIRMRTTTTRVPSAEGPMYMIQPKLISIQCITTTSSSNNDRNMECNQSKKVPLIQQEQAILFVGPVGYGDQCIRANIPFPRPRKLLVPQKWKNSFGTSINRHTLFQRVFRNAAASYCGDSNQNNVETTIGALPANNGVFHPLRRSLRLASKRTSITSSAAAASAAASRMISYRPFCSPFVSTCKNEIILNLSPRYIAYYEVTILSFEPKTTINGNGTISTTSVVRPTMPNSGTTNVTRSFGSIANDTDCVAVGLATNSFPLQHRMPGWDIHSYGYHGDDGGIFHGNGSMIQQYNRKFGVNDTVGCGIDYIHQSIFFTLNGVFLGYAFPLLPQHVDVDLYPVIGMDTQYPITCNFGTNKPFVFDLESMMKQQEPIIRQQVYGMI